MERTASPQAVPPAGGSGLCLLGSRARLVSRRIWTQRGQRSSRRETRSVRSPGREREKVDSARLPPDRASPCRAPHAPCMRGPRAVPPPHLAPLPPAPAGSAGSIRAGGGREERPEPCTRVCASSRPHGRARARGARAQDLARLGGLRGAPRIIQIAWGGRRGSREQRPSVRSFHRPGGGRAGCGSRPGLATAGPTLGRDRVSILGPQGRF